MVEFLSIERTPQAELVLAADGEAKSTQCAILRAGTRHAAPGNTSVDL